MIEEFEIDLIPEDTGPPYEADEPQVLIDVSPHTIDKICKKKYGHTNWARINAISPEEIAGNPCEIDVEHGVIFFKNKLMV